MNGFQWWWILWIVGNLGAIECETFQYEYLLSITTLLEVYKIYQSLYDTFADSKKRPNSSRVDLHTV